MLDTVDVEFDGKAYQFRPTFKVLVDIERKTGKTIFSLFGMSLEQKDFSLSDAVTTLHCLLQAQGETITLEEVADKVMHTGYIQYVAPFLQMFGNALQAGPKEPVKETGAPGEGDSKSRD